MEVERLVNASYAKAKEVIENNMPLLNHLAQTLVAQEVVSTEEFNVMLIDFDAKIAAFTISEEVNKKDLPFQDLPMDFVI